jgi:cell division protein FtsW
MRTATTTLVFCVGALMALGMVVLYSASTVSDGAKFLVKQLAWGGVGIVAAVAAACLPVRVLREVKWLRWGLIALALFLLVIVLIPGIGKVAGGARRWLSVGIGQFQPSELAKLAAIVFLAWYGDLHARRMGEFKAGYLYPILAVGLTMGLIFLEPDWGTALLIGTVAGGMLIAAGTKLRYLLTTAALGLVLLVAAIWHNDVRRERLLAFLDLEKYKETTGYQQWQAQLALGAGGWEGKGLGDGRQKLGFVPEHHTDFILSVIGEELGALASLGVLATFVAIVLAGTFIAMRARDTFSQLLAAGITMMIGLQAIINVAVVTASLPNKGISLPFISYGGSNLVVMLGCVGLLLSVARDAAWQPELETQPGEAGELCFPQFT